MGPQERVTVVSSCAGRTNVSGSGLQSKKRQYDQEVENLERQQKQTIERLEQEHTNRLRDEAKRIKAEQDKELSKYQNLLKNRKKEVSPTAVSHLLSCMDPLCPVHNLNCRESKLKIFK